MIDKQIWVCRKQRTKRKKHRISTEKRIIPGHLRLEDEGFEKKKVPVLLMLATMLAMLELGFTNVN